MAQDARALVKADPGIGCLGYVYRLKFYWQLFEHRFHYQAEGSDPRIGANSERTSNIVVGRRSARFGKAVGRPRVIFRRDRILELRAQGFNWREIALTLGATVTTVRQAVALAGERV